MRFAAAPDTVVTLDKHPKAAGAGLSSRAANRVNRRGAIPRMSRSGEAQVSHLERGVVAAGPEDSDCWSWRESAAAMGGGLRVNNRMQATAGSLVVTASAVRRRA